MKLTNARLFFLVAIAGFCDVSPNAWGQALPGQGALPPLMAEALVRHPQVRMQQALASAAGIDVDSARWQYFPTPSLSVERANTANDPALVNRDDPVTILRLSQPIWTGGKLGANVTRATEVRQSKEAAVQEARQQLSLRVHHWNHKNMTLRQNRFGFQALLRTHREEICVHHTVNWSRKQAAI